MKIERPSREALIRYYRGQSPLQEEALVDLYLSMDLDQAYVESCLREAWHNLEAELDQPLSDDQQQAAWNRFQQQKVNVKQLPARHALKWYGYAASVALLLMGTFAVIHFKSSTTVQLTYEHYTAVLGKRKSIKLKDNSTVMLFPGATLDVPADFNGQARKVILKGRAFFEVAHHRDKPFWVSAGKLVTKDIGTSFEVNEGGLTSTVTLRTGKVSIDHAGKEIARLIPDQQMSYQTGTNKFTIEKVDAGRSLSWINGELSYDLVPLSVICRDLEKWYDVKITISNPVLSHKKMTTSFRDLPVNQVMAMLSATSGLSYTIQGNRIIIK